MGRGKASNVRSDYDWLVAVNCVANEMMIHDEDIVLRSAEVDPEHTVIVRDLISKLSAEAQVALGLILSCPVEFVEALFDVDGIPTIRGLKKFLCNTCGWERSEASKTVSELRKVNEELQDRL